ncbi:CRISPR-associated helicase Cas3' [Desulfarculus baarsii]
MAGEFYARPKDGAPEDQWQTIEEHLTNVAEEAGRMALAFGAGSWGRAAGLLHDLGKYSEAFQRRLRGGPKVDHSTAGARRARALFGPVWGKLLAYAIAGHHAGLANGNDGSPSDLVSRLGESRRKRQIEPYERFDPRLLADLSLVAPPLRRDDERNGFQAAFFARMIFSCLVDADRLDSERFTSPDKAAWRDGWPDVDQLWTRLEAFLAGLRAKAAASPLNKRRNDILDACLAAADQPPGLFSLTVPTGGGKTYSSLAFALRHAHGHGLRRVIYVIPYTSIIDQNASVMRDALGDDAVLEHHSSLPVNDDQKDDGAAFRRGDLAAENWDAPLVITTNVQFFESLFANKPGKCRKLHNIAGSVIILDEAQMLPRDQLRPCLAALRELTLNYGCSVVLCTATQPAFGDAETFDSLAMRPRELAPDPERLYDEFRRVRVVLEGMLSADELAGRLAAHDQVLCVVNTRRHARDVFRRLAAARPTGQVYHLSTLMHASHRRAKLEAIRADLAAGRPCLAVSTQLVEAGVDVDFPHVYRAMAGLDSLAQAAGRCNREGRLAELGLLHVFDCDKQEYKPPHSLIAPMEEGRGVLRRCAAGDDLLSLANIGDYFAGLYHRHKDRLDVGDILAELAPGAKNADFPFATVADLFKYFDSPGQPLLVCDENLRQRIVDGLRHAPNPGLFLRLAQPWLVQLYDNDIRRLERKGVVSRVEEGGLAVLEELALYRDDVGLDIELVDAPADARGLCQ